MTKDIGNILYWLLVAPVHFIGTIIYIVISGTMMVLATFWPIILASLALGALMGVFA